MKKFLGLGLVCILCFAGIINAEIYNWQTGEVIPGTEGITPGPGIWLGEYWNTESKNFKYADFADKDMSGAMFEYGWLDYAIFTNSNLTNAIFFWSVITGADFTDAEIKGARFDRYYDDYDNVWHGTGITSEQLYSTKSYKDKDLSGISLSRNDLSGWNLASQNLTESDFCSATVINTDLNGANLTRAGFDGANLTDADLSGANLTNTDFSSATLTGTDFTDAEIKGADFFLTTSNGFTCDQLYSTISYKNKDLQGIRISGNDLSGWNFEEQNLANAKFSSFGGDAILVGTNFHGANLGYTYFGWATLTDADLSGANLAYADFSWAILTGADFTDAEIRRANFEAVTSRGFTSEQLYSTKSYKDKDLSGIQLGSNDLIGWNFEGQNLTGASFSNFGIDDMGILIGINFHGANLEEAFFEDATLSNVDLSGANLTNAYFGQATLTDSDLSGANLVRTDFHEATLTGTDFTDAEIKGANFNRYYSDYYDTWHGTGITSEQLYSTKSYKDKDLSGIMLGYHDLTGWNFAEFNVTNTDFGSSNLTDTDFSFADLRGAQYQDILGAGAIMRNTIEDYGQINGLDLLDGDILNIRNNPMAISVYDIMAAENGAAMRFMFDEQDWTSTVAMTDGISVELGGTLELAFADGVDIASLIGTSFKIFEWNGLLADGDMFDIIVYANGTQWDVSGLYTTGEVVLTAVPEPMTIAMLCLGGLMIGRKRKSLNA